MSQFTMVWGDGATLTEEADTVVKAAAKTGREDYPVSYIQTHEGGRVEQFVMNVPLAKYNTIPSYAKVAA